MAGYCTVCHTACGPGNYCVSCGKTVQAMSLQVKLARTRPPVPQKPSTCGWCHEPLDQIGPFEHVTACRKRHNRSTNDYRQELQELIEDLEGTTPTIDLVVTIDIRAKHNLSYDDVLNGIPRAINTYVDGVEVQSMDMNIRETHLKWRP